MIATAVTIFVKPEHVNEFIEVTRLNHEGSVREPGNLRFDILQSREDATRFLLYEVYESDADVAEHRKTPHYLKWRETVADWMARPREGVAHDVLFPSDPELW